MPERFPNYSYNLYSFEARDTTEIKTGLAAKGLDYRDIISITWVTDHYRVFYGLKIMT